MTSTQSLKNRADAVLTLKLEEVLNFSHRLYSNPETGLEEAKASAWLVAELEQIERVRVEHGVAGLPTAVRAEAGQGELVLTICAEYDALPGIGHGCGHNIIAAAALGAFIALAPLADDLGVTVRLLGTPAEETVGGKITMLERGCFEGTHAAMMVHPNADDESVMRPYACSGITATFRGKGAHASAAPHEGINALDALTVALTAIGLARQQLKPNQQIHGYVLNAGSAPNVIPDSATAEWMVRAETLESLADVARVLRRCLEAGAVATGATLEVSPIGETFADMRSDGPMTELYAANARLLGRQPRKDTELGGSTDMGNVSQRFPTIHPMVGLGAGCPPIHTSEFAEFAGSRAGDNAVRDGALAMAWTCIDLAAKQEHRTRLLEMARATA